MTRTIAPLAAAVVALFVGACAVGPRYVAPHPAVSDTWLAAPAPGAVDPAWWTGFGDAQLTALIDAAVAGSPDLRAADARLAEARAGRDTVRGGAGPQGGASAAYSRNRLSENGQLPISRIPGVSPEVSLFDAGFDASWEVDLWGRNRRAIEAAGDRVQAAEAARRDVLLRLRAEVARQYFQLRAAQANVDSARADASAQRQEADLVAARFRGGEASRFDLHRAEAQARATASAIPALEGDERAAAYAVARLVGRPPEALAGQLLVHAPIPGPPDLLAAGLRSDILRRRPDIVQAERTLAAATADVAVATADLFPRLMLSGTLGQQSQSLGDLALAGSNRFSAGPTVRWPILQRGAIRAQIRAAGARADAASAVYETAVLGALADSETALDRFARAGAGLAEATAGDAAAQGALTLARQRYQAGEDDLLALLTAESAAAAADRRLTDARLARAVGAVAAYKALGL